MSATKFKFVACPFCNASEGFSLADNADPGSMTYWVVCGAKTCGAEGPFRKSPEAAVKAWNARSSVAA